MSTPPLFLLDELPAAETVLLDGAEGHHAARVRRLRAGEPVLVGDGAGTVLDCTVAAARADGLELQVTARRTTARPDPRLVVVQALPKAERAELAIEAMTELGVDEIVPWAASRSIVKWPHPRAEKALSRWRSTAREAGKQSRRAWLPQIAPLASTAEVALRLAAGCGLVLDPAGSMPLASYALPATGEIVAVVGPEGGLSPEEADAFARAGAACVRLGAPVLRTSTAGAAALAALSVRLARWA